MQDFLIALLGDIFGKADRDTSAVAMTFAKKLQDNWQKIFYSLTIPGMIKNGTAVPAHHRLPRGGAAGKRHRDL